MLCDFDQSDKANEHFSIMDLIGTEKNNQIRMPIHDISVGLKNKYILKLRYLIEILN